MKRFWDKVDRSPGQGPEGSCWGWTAGCNRAGYGQFKHGERIVGAHRMAWKLERGPIPEGLCVLHRCDTPGCVNPDHLFLGTNADNSQDMVRKGRHLVGHREKGRKQQGEKNSLAKLTDDQVLAIRREWAADGVTKQALANRHGVDRTVIGKIVRDKAWRHLPLVPE